MRVPTRNLVLGVLAFVAVAAAWQYVFVRYGDTEGFRVWGLAILLVSFFYLFVAEIPVAIGSRSFPPLKGWRKADVIAPAFLIGLVVSLHPHEVACALYMRGYVCP
jgi:hypothetical protein